MRGVNTGILIGHATHNAELESTQTAKIRLQPPPNHQTHDQGEEETRFPMIGCWDRLTETTAIGVARDKLLEVV